MNKKNEQLINLAALRKQAEQEMLIHSDLVLDPLMTDERRLLHELQVHQIELEMQNQALLEALTEREAAFKNSEREHARYLELFDFAPIAYFGLDSHQVIQNANFCAGTLFDLERSALLGQSFSKYVCNAYHPAFERFIDDVFSGVNRDSHYCEITVQKGDKPCWVAIKAIVDKSMKTCLMAVLNISERKQNEEYLRKNHAFIISILNSMHQQIAVLDKQGVILAVNNAWIKFGKDNGLPIRNQHWLGFNYLDACKNDVGQFLCEDAHQAYLGIQAVLIGKKTQFFLEYPCHSDDRQSWFQMTVTPLKGQSYGAVICHEDVTQRKQTERLPNILTAMFDVSMDGFWEVDLIGNLLKANEAYARMSGYSLDELRLMNIRQLEVVEDSEQIKRHMAKVVEQGYDRFETGHRHKDGHIIDMEIAATYLPEFKQFCVFCRDISPRKQAEGKLNAIFSASVEGIISFNIYNAILTANPAIETIFGYSPEELINQDITLLIPELPKCMYGCCLPGAIKKSAQIIERQGIHKNGSLLDIELTRTEYTINNSCYFVIFLRDISLRKQREHEDKAHLDELAHITRLGLMGEMASGIAHELNQPMAAISSYTQAGINQVNSEKCDLAELSEILIKTQQQGLRAGQIIHRMREFMKASPKHLSTVEINSLVIDATSLCSDDIKLNQINLIFGFENDLPFIIADHIQIEQVLINLIRNSIDTLQYLPKYQPRQISIQTRLNSDEFIEVRVKDNGQGIDEDQQTKILTPFYTTKKTGMGMGLAICRSLIEAHNGTLRFTSKPGKGSTFYFTLPTRKKIHDA